MVAFGGAAPLHACRLAERLGIEKVIVPPGGGRGVRLLASCERLSPTSWCAPAISDLTDSTPNR